jgi:hypothetical protein
MLIDNEPAYYAGEMDVVKMHWQKWQYWQYRQKTTISPYKKKH